MQPVMETILHRRSIRRFAPEQIREETLAQILQAGPVSYTHLTLPTIA